MHTKVTVLLLVALVSNAVALNCFFCIGSLTSDCFNGVVPSMLVQDCSLSLGNATRIGLPISTGTVEQRDDPPIVMSCVSFIGHSMGTTFFERGCGFIWEGVDICDYLAESIDVLNCESCDDRDLCNDSIF